MNRRLCLVAWPVLALALAAHRPSRAAVWDQDIQDVEVGSSTTSVLDPKTSQRLVVRSKLRTRDIRWVDAQGRVQFTSSQTLVDNNYDWQTSVQRSTDVWRITSEDLKSPTWLVLRVRSTQRLPLVVSLFPGATSASGLDPALGIEVQPSDEAAHEWLALFEFDPQAKTFITVQAQASQRVPYRVGVQLASRFKR